MSDAMDEVFGARRHRPDTPDLWRISEILLANDGAMDDARTTDAKEAEWQRRTSSVVDVQTVTYVGVQRVLRILGAGNAQGAAFGLPAANQLTPAQKASMAALWVDAFITGAMFQQRGGHQEG